MPYSVTVIDDYSRAPVKGATVVFFDYDGERLTSFVTDAAGRVTLDPVENEVEIANGAYEVTAPGYYQAARFAGQPLDVETIEVRRQPHGVPIGLLLAAGAGVYAVTRKQKTVGKIDVKAVTPWIAPVVGVSIVGILFYKVGQKFGLFDDAAAKKRKAEAAAREKDAQAAMDQLCRATPSTKTAADWVDIANQLETALDYAGYLSSSEDKAVYQLCRAQNDCDVQKMVYYFGTRQLRDLFLIKGGPLAKDFTLGEGIQERLSKKNIDIVNDNYARKYINFRW